MPEIVAMSLEQAQSLNASINTLAATVADMASDNALLKEELNSFYLLWAGARVCCRFSSKTDYAERTTRVAQAR